MKICALVPVKPLDHAKTRLAAVLSPQERADLVLRMFMNTLKVLSGWEALDKIVVTSADPKIWQAAASYGVDVLKEEQALGLNCSLTTAVAVLEENTSIDAVLIIHADLPNITLESLQRVIESGEEAPFVVVVSDQQKTGTNVLLAAPPDVIPFCYGKNSYQRHKDEAVKRGVKFVTVEEPDLALDIDLPGDLSAC